MVDDRPLAVGTVSFTPDESKGTKSEFTGFSMVQDGAYKLQTGTANQIKDGVPAGFYKVTIQTKAAMGQQAAPKEGALFVETKEIAIDSKYSDPKRTPIEIEVKEGAAEGSYDISIKTK
jgi:hypothetical protein